MPDTTKAITPFDKFKEVAVSDPTRAMINDAVGNDPDMASRYVSNLLTIAGQRNDLLECDPPSILRSACQAAALGLMLEPALGQAHLVPYGSQTGKHAQLIIGYKGYQTLARNTGLYSVMNVAPWYEGEELLEDRLSGKVRLTGFPVDGKTPERVVGYVGILVVKGTGEEHYLAMTLDEIRMHIQRYNPKGFNNPNGPWKKEFHKMCSKTIARLLLTRWGTFSIKQVKVMEELDKQEVDPDQVIDTTWIEREVKDEEEIDPVYQEGYVGDPPIPAPEPEPEQITTERKPFSRPLIPIELKTSMDKKALGYAGKTCTKKQVSLLAMLLETIFEGDKDARHAVQEYLFGEESLTDTEPEFILSALDWLKPTETDGGYLPDKLAIQEAQAVLAQLREDELA